MNVWKTSQTPLAVAHPAPEPIRFESATPANEYSPRMSVVPQPEAAESASIAKGMVFNGTVTGTGSLFVEGEVVGNINLPNCRVTVGPTGKVSDGLSVCIRAREIVIMGNVRGNVSATDRVEICAEGTLNGSVSAARISIADGAYFKGDINLLTQPKPASAYVEEEERTRAYA
jgi:cytoskeletal protein CcmA (bactofilin family)